MDTLIQKAKSLLAKLIDMVEGKAAPAVQPTPAPVEVKTEPVAVVEPVVELTKEAAPKKAAKAKTAKPRKKKS